MKFANVHDVLTIGIFALVFVWLANKGLSMIGLQKFTTGGAAASNGN